MKKAEIVQVEVNTVFEIIEPIQTLTTDICDLSGFNEEQSYWIAMAVREALNNAILHGNQMDEQKKIFLKFEIKEDRLLVHIQDEGPGSQDCCNCQEGGAYLFAGKFQAVEAAGAFACP